MPLIKSMARKFGVFEYEENICESQMILIEAIGTYDKSKGTFGNYLKNQLRYHFLDKSKKERPLSLDDYDEDGQRYIDSLLSDCDIEKQILENEKYQELEKAIGKLEKRDQEIIKMSYYENLKNAEIAKKLNISPKTVANRKSLSIKRLGEIMRKNYEIINN